MGRVEGKLSLGEYRRATHLTRGLTMFNSFAELLTARGLSPAGYRPVLYTTPHPVRPRRKYSPAELQRRQLILTGAGELADLYDRAQAQRGDGRRAVRL